MSPVALYHCFNYLLLLYSCSECYLLILHSFHWFLKMLLRDIIPSRWKLRSLQILHWFGESDFYEFLHQLGQWNYKMTIQQLNTWAVFLSSLRNWDDWFSVAKFTDLRLKIWDYVNSDNSEDSVLSTDSASSKVSQIKADTTMITDLKKDELS